jgi:endonuclease/exonuclease/phosphatase family metal-dependent hydrolase
MIFFGLGLSACSINLAPSDSSANPVQSSVSSAFSASGGGDSASSVLGGMSSASGSSRSYSPAPAKSAYTIFTYNVEKFDRGVGSGNAPRPYGTVTYFSEIATIIKTNDADVLGLAEVTDANPGEADNFAAALGAVSWPMPFYHFSSRSDSYNCIGYYSRYPVSDVSEIGRSGAITWSATRTIYRYKVTFPGGHEVWFYSCHLKSGQDSGSVQRRVAEATGLGRYIRANHNVKTDYIVVMGDMNTMNALDWPSDMPPSNDDTPASGFDATKIPKGNPTGCAVSLLEHKNQPDSAAWFTSLTREYIYPATTMPGWDKSCPLDHIVLSPALYNDHYVVDSMKMVNTGSLEQSPSDHYGVLCQLWF